MSLLPEAVYMLLTLGFVTVHDSTIPPSLLPPSPVASYSSGSSASSGRSDDMIEQSIGMRAGDLMAQATRAALLRDQQHQLRLANAPRLDNAPNHDYDNDGKPNKSKKRKQRTQPQTIAATATPLPLPSSSSSTTMGTVTETKSLMRSVAAANDVTMASLQSSKYPLYSTISVASHMFATQPTIISALTITTPFASAPRVSSLAKHEQLQV